jgi:hypothetical protein
VPSFTQVLLALDNAQEADLLLSVARNALGAISSVSAVATPSTGELPIPGSKPHKAQMCRLQQLSRSLSRRLKGFGPPKEDQGKNGETACPHCGAKEGRNVNAAINLKNMAVRPTGGIPVEGLETRDLVVSERSTVIGR